MLNKNRTQKTILNFIGGAFLLALFTVLAAVIAASAALSNHDNGNRTVKIGPFAVAKIEKQSGADDSVTATMEVQSGLYAYTGVLVALGATTGYLFARKKNNHPTDEN